MKRLLPALVLLATFSPRVATAQRALDIVVEKSGWGDTQPQDIRAVLLSAGGEIWKNCPHTKLDPIFVHHRDEGPITNWKRAADGKIVIGLASEDNRWAQFAFQFAHEFCHALANHSNDWHKTWREDGKPNNWLEESICETASLFSLRAMAKSWQTAPPYLNWRDFSKHLASYAQERLDDPKHHVPPGMDFQIWMRRNESAMRSNSTIREKNCIVAAQLLPLFEAEPRGWEAMTFFNLGAHDKEMKLARFFAEWQRNCPPDLRPFVAKVALVFDVRL